MWHWRPLWYQQKVGYFTFTWVVTPIFGGLHQKPRECKKSTLNHKLFLKPSHMEFFKLKCLLKVCFQLSVTETARGILLHLIPELLLK